MQWNPRNQSPNGRPGGGSSSSESSCQHSLCPASQRPLRWRTKRVPTSFRGRIRVLLRRQRDLRGRTAGRRSHLRRRRRLRRRDRDGCRRQVAHRRSRDGRVRADARRGHPSRGRRRRRGPGHGHLRVRAHQAEGRELLPRRGPAHHDRHRRAGAHPVHQRPELRPPACTRRDRTVAHLRHHRALELRARRDDHVRRAHGADLRRRPGVADLARDHHRDRAECRARLDARCDDLETAAKAGRGPHPVHDREHRPLARAQVHLPVHLRRIDEAVARCDDPVRHPHRTGHRFRGSTSPA